MLTALGNEVASTWQGMVSGRLPGRTDESFDPSRLAAGSPAKFATSTPAASSTEGGRRTDATSKCRHRRLAPGEEQADCRTLRAGGRADRGSI